MMEKVEMDNVIQQQKVKEESRKKVPYAHYNAVRIPKSRPITNEINDVMQHKFHRNTP